MGLLAIVQIEWESQTLQRKVQSDGIVDYIVQIKVLQFSCRVIPVSILWRIKAGANFERHMGSHPTTDGCCGHLHQASEI